MGTLSLYSFGKVTPPALPALLVSLVLAAGTVSYAIEPAAPQAQETVLVPEQYTSYRLVYETSFEEQKQIQYRPILQQEWRSVPQVVSKTVIHMNGQVHLQNFQQVTNSPVWTYRWSPQETVANVQNVKAFWKPYTVTRYVPKQVPTGTPAPPTKLSNGNGNGPGENGKASDGSGNGDKGDQQALAPDPENKKLKSELEKLKRENERLKDTLAEILGNRSANGKESE